MESKRKDDFDAVYKECRDYIYRITLRNIHNPDDAEDITQEAFTRYYVHCAHSEVEKPKSWIAVTARNLAYNHMKHKKYERLLLEDEDVTTMLGDVPDFTDSFFENLWRRDRLEYTDKIFEVVKERNKRWYDALIYAYCMEMPGHSIAECMGMSEGALSSLLQRARNWIKENYRDEFDHITRT